MAVRKSKATISHAPAKPGKADVTDVTTNAAQQVDAVVVNSLDDVNKIHAQQESARVHNRKSVIQAALGVANEFTSNLGGSELIRTEFLRFLLDGPKDIDADCGYPAWLTPDHYRAMWDREGIAARVVDCEPKETWTVPPEIYEDEDEDEETEFEKALDALEKSHNINHYLQRIDILSGIGQFGILLFGINDGKDLHEPVDGMNDDGTIDEGNEYKLNYIRPFDESVTFVKIRETDPTNPRYGKPKVYTIMFRDFPNWGIQAGEIISRDVHWTRVLHVADNRKMSEIYGIPRMQQVWNRLYDLRKIYSSSGEAFWKGGFPGMAFEVDPEIANQGVELDKDELREEMAKYQNGMQRYFAVTGVKVNSLPPNITDPTNTVKCHLTAIAISKGIPYRILFGSEEAKLASDKDSEAWNKRLKRRQDEYVTPMLVRPFIDLMIAYGVLPKPEEYFVEWDDLNNPSDLDKAQVSLAKTQAIGQYVQSGMSSLMPPTEFFTLIMGFTTEEATQIADAMQQMNSDDLADMGGDDEEQQGNEGQEDDVDNQTEEGGLGGVQRDNGSNLLQKNLSGGTTVGRGGKRNDPTLIQMPSLNSGRKVNGKLTRIPKRDAFRKSRLIKPAN